MYVYVYIYIYMYMCAYIYIYIHRQMRSKEGFPNNHVCLPEGAKVPKNPETTTEN